MAQEVEAGVRSETGTVTFGDRIAAAVDTKRSQLVVGLDPRPELLPVELRGDVHHGRAAAADAVGRFCRGLIDAVAPYVVGVKAQLAYFETLGADGIRAFEDVCDYARSANLIVIADAKRGDIGSTARAYADAYLERREDMPPPVDALTVSPYLGSDSIEPFLAACRRSGNGIFCLVKTSNAGSADLQDAALSDGRRLWHQVAELVDAWGQDLIGERGLSSVGAVVGATYPRAVAEARKLMPQAILLLPGVGAQGGTPADVARAFTSGPASALVPVSRSVIYAFRVDGADWRTAAAGAAARLRDDVWTVSGW
ncbi:MAG TPA: orotidine-5'-phosphate decarboxylase [Gaiellaceae bacterium]|jgi:orotidine-5'-phosphate decarboxylase|nr:orotidine-5'-phosphate decarboxylase [Gaiellaceae bacterium]